MKNVFIFILVFNYYSITANEMFTVKDSEEPDFDYIEYESKESSSEYASFSILSKLNIFNYENTEYEENIFNSLTIGVIDLESLRKFNFSTSSNSFSFNNTKEEYLNSYNKLIANSIKTVNKNIIHSIGKYQMNESLIYIKFLNITEDLTLNIYDEDDLLELINNLENRKDISKYNNFEHLGFIHFFLIYEYNQVDDTISFNDNIISGNISLDSKFIDKISKSSIIKEAIERKYELSKRYTDIIKEYNQTLRQNLFTYLPYNEIDKINSLIENLIIDLTEYEEIQLQEKGLSKYNKILDDLDNIRSISYSIKTLIVTNPSKIKMLFICISIVVVIILLFLVKSIKDNLKLNLENKIK